jgi:hypothetical protein
VGRKRDRGGGKEEGSREGRWGKEEGLKRRKRERKKAMKGEGRKNTVMVGTALTQ